MRRHQTVAVAVLFWAYTQPAWAQQASIEGVVHDALGRPVAGAMVRLEAGDGKDIAKTTADQSGHFSFAGVAAGTYAVVVSKAQYEEGTVIVSPGASGVSSADLVLQAQGALEMAVAAQKLAEARSEIEPRIGATTYTMSSQAIENQPGGEDVSLSQTLLQAPGVSQDSFGQIHLRNDHANIQYRINGVILPEGISLFGQSLNSRFASSIDLITGSLPAQYGLVNTGIVDIQTKSGAFEPGGSVGMYGGSHGWMEPSADYAGSAGHFNYFVSGDYLQNGIGIENPTSSNHPIHDDTQQGHGFAYLEDIIDPSTKVSAIFGGYQGRFQIPDNPGQAPSYQYGNQTTFDSSKLNESQQENNDFLALSYLKSTQNYDYQLSAFTRYSTLNYKPDTVGDLMFYGLAQDANRGDQAEGLQADATYRLTTNHTLRYGGLITAEHATSSTNSQVFACLNADCSNTGTTPQSIYDKSAITGWTYSSYLQDEWKLTPSVTLNYGARYDVLNAYTNADQISPRVNAVWKPEDDTTLHAGYSRYFTPPALENISGTSIAKFAGTTGYPAGYSSASPPQDGAILPERSDYFDVGADHSFSSGLKLGIDGYYKIARDLIDEGQFGAPVILSVFNYDHAQVYGTEFTSSYTQGNWSAYGNLAYGREHASNVVSQQFNFSPDDLAYINGHYIYTDHSQWITASSGLSYNWQGTRFSSDLIYGTGLRQDAGAVPNGGTVTPYTQVNFGVSHRFEEAKGGPLELSLNLINAFDRSYQIRSGSGVGVFAPQYGPREEIFAGIRKFF
jgi:outer membrane receptor protein involved in Fe transport